jgi:type II secretory pathway component PulF
MFRKLAFASFALNGIVLVVVLYGFVPWLLRILAPLKIEIPTPMLWVISASDFVRNPRSIFPTLLLLVLFLVGGFAVHAFYKHTLNSRPSSF